MNEWRNDKELRELICDNDTAIKPSKILEVQCDEQHDIIVCDLKDIFDQAKDLSPTKRNILKTLASYFWSFRTFTTYSITLEAFVLKIMLNKIKLGHWNHIRFY